MKFFDYRAISADGVQVNGQSAAISELLLDEELELRGLLLTRAREVKRSKSAKCPGISRSELIQLTSSLATLHGAGLPLVDGLRGLKNRSASPRIELLLGQMLVQLEAGKSLTEVVENHPQAFPCVFRASIAAGEASGSLDRVLTGLVKHMEWSDEMRATTTQALIYPSILLGAIGVLIGILLFHVLPNIVGMFPDGTVDLPQETQAVLAIASFFSERAMLFATGLALFVVAFVVSLRVAPLRLAISRAFIALPLFGRLASKIAISKFSATASILKQSGCDVITLIQVSARATGNGAMQDAFERCAERVKAGLPFSKAMQSEPLIDPLLIEVTSIGESSGDLGPALRQLSEHYERVVPRCVRKSLAIFEPTLLVCTGVVVALVLLAAMLPIFDMYNKLG